MRPQIVVGGYVCLDVIPTFDDQKEVLAPLFQPGKLLSVGTVVGAFNVEGPDATNSIPDWDSVQARIQAGWTQHTPALSLAGWQQKKLIWTGPDDNLLSRKS